MDDCGLHRISEDLSEDWVDSFAVEGLDQVDAYLAKHAAFQTFLEDRD